MASKLINSFLWLNHEVAQAKECRQAQNYGRPEIVKTNNSFLKWTVVFAGKCSMHIPICLSVDPVDWARMIDWGRGEERGSECPTCSS